MKDRAIWSLSFFFSWTFFVQNYFLKKFQKLVDSSKFLWYLLIIASDLNPVSEILTQDCHLLLC
jgi:hypothetical protein